MSVRRTYQRPGPSPTADLAYELDCLGSLSMRDLQARWRSPEGQAPPPLTRDLLARAITGGSWNGHRFFGLAPRGEKGARPTIGETSS